MIAKNYIFGRKYGANLLDGLVAYYPLNSNANDFSGNNHNGTLVNSPTFVAGKVSNTVDFGNDTTVRYINFGDKNDFSFTDGITDLPLSISLWVKFHSFSSGGNSLITKYSNSAFEWRIFRRTQTNRIEFDIFNQNQNTVRIAVMSQIISDLNQWIHICATYNGNSNSSGLNLYINGILNNYNKVSNVNYVKMNNTTSSMLVGNLQQLLDETFKHRGMVDEISIWKNRELTSTEVLELYNKGNAGTPII